NLIGKRSTTVRASTDVRAYKLDPALFQSLLANHPEIKQYIQLEQRHRHLSNFIKLYTVFAKLPPEAMELLALESRSITVKAGDSVITEGDASGSMFIVEEGRVRVCERQGERQRAKAFLRKGDLLGELSIARNQPRRATVEAITECRLIEISERTFGKLYARFSEFRKKIEERIASYDYKKTARL